MAAPFRTTRKRSFAAVDVPGEDQVLFNHSNGLVVITMAPSHPAVSEGRTVSRVRFEGTKRNLGNNAVRGKWKKGGNFMQPRDQLCVVQCDDGSEHTLRACVRGNLVEVNERLLTEPALLKASPSDAGFLAVVMPKEGDRITGSVEAIEEELAARLGASSSGADGRKGAHRVADRQGAEAEPPNGAAVSSTSGLRSEAHSDAAE